jgi:hypothetical protein
MAKYWDYEIAVQTVASFGVKTETYFRQGRELELHG